MHLQGESPEVQNTQMKGRSIAVLLLMIFGAELLSEAISANALNSPDFAEEVSLDWNHSGTPTTFTLSFQHRTDGAGDSDRLSIQRPGSKQWILLNNDDEWTPLITEIPPVLLRKNLVQSTRMLFISSGAQPKARIYLILKGGGYGCCVGSLTVIAPGADGTPKVVFHAVEHLLQDILLQPDRAGIALVGQPSDAEARTQENAASYDPYRIYILQGDQPAHYDLEKSKGYTVKHYCQWAGPTYNEKFVAVNMNQGQSGAGHCRTMTEAQFDAYRTKHSAQFP